MKKTILLATAALTITASALTHQANAADLTNEQIEKIVENYILNNGDKLMEGITNFQKKQQEESERTAAEKLKSSKAYIDDPSHPAIGPEDADVTIVEFFDYNCGYCKKAFDDIQKIAKTDKKTRFVFMEMPILGPTSLTAAQWSLAANEQGKYFEYHTLLMNHRGPKTEIELKKLAKRAKLDVDKMAKDAKSEKINAAIKKSMQFSQDLGVRGTPAFIAGDEMVRGYVGLDGLKTKIAELRNKK